MLFIMEYCMLARFYFVINALSGNHTHLQRPYSLNKQHNMVTDETNSKRLQETRKAKILDRSRSFASLGATNG